MFTYNAKACDGQLCLESSPTENPSFFVHSPHATRLEVSAWCQSDSARLEREIEMHPPNNARVEKGLVFAVAKLRSRGVLVKNFLV